MRKQTLGVATLPESQEMQVQGDTQQGSLAPVDVVESSDAV